MEFVFEPWHWWTLGLILMLSELIIPAFAALWFGLAALLVGVLLWIFPSMQFNTQMLIWAIASVSCTILWFKYVKPLSIDKTRAGLARENTIGQIGMVIQVGLTHEQIMVRFAMPVLGSDEWYCRATQTVHVGDRVQVIDILGNHLLVQPYSSTTTITKE